MFERQLTPFNHPPVVASRRTPIFFDRKTRTIGIIFLPIYLPLFLLLGVFSIPWMYFTQILARKREREFTELMKERGRTAPLEGLYDLASAGEGTVIYEMLSVHGPSRIWWTPVDIPAKSPFKCAAGDKNAWMDPEFRPFSNWCREEFTNPLIGSAHLIVVPEKKRKETVDKLSQLKFVSILPGAVHRKKSFKKG